MFFKRIYSTRLDRVVKLYLATKFVGALYFVYPIFYQFSSQTITPVEIGLFFSIISLCNFVTDIPTSILADKYSRKLITVVGVVLLTIAPWLVLQAHTFSLFVVAAIFYGVGGACMNGAIEALMYDHKNVSKETFRRVNALEITWGQAGILVSAAVGGMLFTANRAFPFIAQVIAGLVWLAILTYIQEQNKVDYAKSQASYGRHLVQSLRYLLATSYLRILVIMGVTFSVMLGVCIQFVHEAAMIENGIGPTARGFLIAGAGLATILIVNTVLLKHLKTDARRILYMAFGALAAYLFMAIGGLPFFLAGYLLWCCLNATSSFIRLIVHDRIPGSHRATIMSSFKGLAVLIGLGGSGATGLLIHWARTPRVAYAVFGVLSLCVLVPCAVWLLMHRETMPKPLST